MPLREKSFSNKTNRISKALLIIDRDICQPAAAATSKYSSMTVPEIMKPSQVWTIMSQLLPHFNSMNIRPQIPLLRPITKEKLSSFQLQLTKTSSTSNQIWIYSETLVVILLPLERTLTLHFSNLPRLQFAKIRSCLWMWLSRLNTWSPATTNHFAYGSCQHSKASGKKEVWINKLPPGRDLLAITKSNLE